MTDDTAGGITGRRQLMHWGGDPIDLPPTTPRIALHILRSQAWALVIYTDKAAHTHLQLSQDYTETEILGKR